ncbi:pectinesterase-like [Salvia hispanica]|uniref:pectinesterase-like n=1 Tax=Salvia hispanica TaxID=49212 RepID=UPI0020093A41|nr:pectinesterase-like [Salvia hispanica]
MQEIASSISYFSEKGELSSIIDADNKLGLSALKCCQELLPLAMDNLNRSLTSDDEGGALSSTCAAGTTLQTCVDGFADQPRVMFEAVHKKLEYIIDLNRVAIKMMASTITSDDDVLNPEDEYPGWVSDGDRDRFLLQADSRMIRADVVVAKDGSGKYRTVSEAVKDAPRYSKTRFVIYVKSGVYVEKVKIDSDRWNVMMFGDGIDKTIISYNLSHGAGFQTYETATFTVQGQGFIARDMTFTNTAGAINQQAVALVSHSERSVFYRCSFNGYQDTLYAHVNRQFYRECQISGTIDFIFGDAAMVIQRSSILVRKPLPGQQNAITAQGKIDRLCRTGIVVQSSTIRASQDLRGVSTFLGRPWKPYATVVFMQNNMSRLIDLKGWFPWKAAESTRNDTVFLAEYSNRGPGARTRDRVKWKGVRKNLSYAEATGFTVASFILQRNNWLLPTQVPYDLAL